MSPFRRIVLDGDPVIDQAAGDALVRVILDPSWSALVGGDPRVVGLRDIVAPILDREDPFEAAFAALDEWAAAIDVPGRMAVDGISWWYRRRLWMWLWLAERVHWAAVLDELLARHGPIDEVEVRGDEAALGDMVVAFGRARGFHAVELPTRAGPTGYGTVADEAADRRTATPTVRPGVSAVLSLSDRVRWRLGRHPRQRRMRELEEREAALMERLTTLARTGRNRVLVLTSPAVHQVVGGSGSTIRADPFLGPVVDLLRGSDLTPVVVRLATSFRDDTAWRATAADPDAVPDALLAARFAEPGDEAAGTAAAAAVEAALAAAPDRALDVGGVDLSPAILAQLRAFARVAIEGRVRAAARAARLIQAVGAGAVLLVNEYSLTEWIAAGRAVGVPVLAVQHGVIVPHHVGYRHNRHPALALPTRTFVSGPYEARVLVENGGYRPDEIEVTGAPRLDTDRFVAGSEVARKSAVTQAERVALRVGLGVKTGDRMLVISTTHEPIHRRFSWPHALGRLLGEPLPGVHLVFKLHPAETDDGAHRRLVEGLALAGGFAPPPVSVVRDVDLYALLRAADAHLGLYSTVLSDAVATGTPNLIAATQARTDLVGYVGAGVALPVRTAGELRAALADPQPPDAERRQAFLADHFRPGDASSRIVAGIRSAIAASVAQGAPDGDMAPDATRGEAAPLIDGRP